MRVHGIGELEAFCQERRDACNSLQAWKAEVEEAVWQRPQDIKDRYASASFLHDNIVIFNIRGNRYRLVTKVNYTGQIVLVKWIGTHAEYDRKTW